MKKVFIFTMAAMIAVPLWAQSGSSSSTMGSGQHNPSGHESATSTKGTATTMKKKSTTTETTTTHPSTQQKMEEHSSKDAGMKKNR